DVALEMNDRVLLGLRPETLAADIRAHPGLDHRADRGGRHHPERDEREQRREPQHPATIAGTGTLLAVGNEGGHALLRCPSSVACASGTNHPPTVGGPAHSSDVAPALASPGATAATLGPCAEASRCCADRTNRPPPVRSRRPPASSSARSAAIARRRNGTAPRSKRRSRRSR